MEMRSPNAKEEKLKLKASEQLEADRVRLLMDQPFIGAFLIRQNLIPVVDVRCDTAATDGQNIFVNPEFYLALTPAERRFLLAHEVWHTVYLHFMRRKDRDRELFNIATDMEINRLLRYDGFKLPEGALLPPPQWDLLNAEGIYDELVKELPPDLEPIDCHLEPEDEKMPLPNQPDKSDKNGKKGETKKQVTPGENGEDIDANCDGGEDDVIVIDPDFQIDFGSHPEDKVREKVMEAATQHERQRGTLPANYATIVEKYRSGKLHWKELLAQFVTSCFGGSRRWLPPNRRYVSSGLYLQSRRDSQIKAVLAFDTSGSTNEYLPLFAGELSNLLNSFGSYELKVICCDAKVQSVETFSSVAPYEKSKFKFKGGGGTSFTPVFKYIKNERENPDLLIYLTDGYGDIPEKPPYPVLWVITPGGKHQVPWGYVAEME